MVVGTLNLESETGLQFQVPTTMRRHGVTGAQTGSETGSKKGIETGGEMGQNATKMLQCKVTTTIWGKGATQRARQAARTLSHPCPTPCLGLPHLMPLMVVGTLNCSPI